MNRNQSILLVAGLLMAAALTRLIPHWPNFTSVGAVALLGGAWIRNKGLAVVLPLFALFISDLILNNVVYASFNEGFTLFYSGMAFVYGSFALISILGIHGLSGRANTSNSGRFVGFSVLATVLFFALSNFGAWLGNPMYPQSALGLTEAYAAGLPYALNSLAGTLVFGFGMMFVRERVFGMKGVQA